MSGELHLPASPQGGSPGAGEELGRAFIAGRAELVGYAKQRLGDEGLAEEAVQETFVRALRAKRPFDPGRGPVRAWLFAIERRVITDLARARAHRRAAAVAADAAMLDDGAEARATAAQIGSALEQLSSEHRQVIVEIYLKGRRPAELARSLHLAEGTVRSRLYYALRNLRRQLEAEGWEW